MAGRLSGGSRLCRADPRGRARGYDRQWAWRRRHDAVVRVSRGRCRALIGRRSAWHASAWSPSCSSSPGHGRASEAWAAPVAAYASCPRPRAGLLPAHAQPMWRQAPRQARLVHGAVIKCSVARCAIAGDRSGGSTIERDDTGDSALVGPARQLAGGRLLVGGQHGDVLCDR